MRRELIRFVGKSVLAVAVMGCSSALHAQDTPPAPPQGGGMRGQLAGAQRVAGEVVSVSAPNLSVKNIETGQTVTVVTTTNTRMMRGQGETLDLASLKPGDGIVAMGQLDAPSKSLHAMMVMGLTADQVKQMQHAAAEMKANLGKTYIAGKVTAVDIDNLKMTVQRPDGEAQTIGFDEGTSFKKGGRVTGIGGGSMFAGGGRRGGAGGTNGTSASGAQAAQAGSNTPAITGGESITLADIKVGDNVVGLGSVKAGTFVPSTLNVQVRGEGGGRRGPNGGAGTQPFPDSPKPI